MLYQLTAKNAMEILKSKWRLHRALSGILAATATRAIDGFGRPMQRIEGKILDDRTPATVTDLEESKSEVSVRIETCHLPSLALCISILVIVCLRLFSSGICDVSDERCNYRMHAETLGNGIFASVPSMAICAQLQRFVLMAHHSFTFMVGPVM